MAVTLVLLMGLEHVSAVKKRENLVRKYDNKDLHASEENNRKALSPLRSQAKSAGERASAIEDHLFT